MSAVTPVRAKSLSSTALVYLVLVAFVIIAAVLTGASGGNFFSAGNLTSIFTSMTVLGFIAIGQTLVILAGSLDLSVPYVVSAATLLAGSQMAGSNSGLMTGILLALVVCGLIGLVSGMIVSLLGVHGFMTTLGVGLILSGYLASKVTGQGGKASPALMNFGIQGIGGVIPVATVLMLVCAALVWGMLHFTRLGHHLFAVGGNSSVARMSGVRTAIPVISAHVMCSVLAGIAGLILLSRTGLGSPVVGTQGRYDLFSIAAVVIGGTLLAGGKGSIVGTIGGVAIFAVLDNVMSSMEVNSFLRDFIRGVMIVGAVAVYARRSIVARPERFSHSGAGAAKEETA